jgi:hypothetical protein
MSTLSRFRDAIITPHVRLHGNNNKPNILMSSKVTTAPTEPTFVRWTDLVRVKNRAFTANRQAKLSRDKDRELFYRVKDGAINCLLETGTAFVISVDWSVPDPVFGVQFVGGGQLHTRLSSLSSGAFRSVRRQLNGCLTPESRTVAPDCGFSEQQNTWN